MTDYLSKKIKILSFTAICFVFLQHAINFTGYIDPNSVFAGRATINTIIQYSIGYGVARIAVPLFFLLSAYLFYISFDISRLFAKYASRVRTLLIPYILWNVLSILGVMLLQRFFPIANNLYTGTITEFSIRTMWQHGVSFQLWFLYDLMLYTLLAPVIYVAIRHTAFVLPVLAFVLWFAGLPLPPYLALVGRGACFYVFGAYIAMRGKTVSIPSFTILLWIVIIIIKTGKAFFPGLLPTVPIAFLDSTAIVFGVCAIWKLYDIYASSAGMSWIMQWTPYTFFVYAFHEPFLELLKLALFTAIGVSQMSMFVGYISIPVVTCILSMLTARMMKYGVPKIYSLLTGGR